MEGRLATEDKYIGHFGDARLDNVGKKLLSDIIEQRTVVVRRLGGERKVEMQFHRFLNNDRVEVEKMISHASECTKERAKGRNVLVIHDTTELNYKHHDDSKSGFGVTGNDKDIGVFLHPQIAVEAETGGIIGVSGLFIHNRDAAPIANADAYLPKESKRWLAAAEENGELLKESASITMVADRESDTYESFSLRPNNVHILSRAAQNRKLNNGKLLFSAIKDFAESDTYEIAVAEKRKQKQRTAKVTLRFGEVTISIPEKYTARPDLPPQVTLRVVSVEEQNPPPNVESIRWILLTTHEVNTLEDAQKMIRWYRQRWIIEEMNRSLKSQGMNIEASQICTPAAIAKMAVLATIAAVKIIQMVRARDGTTGQSYLDGFEAEDLELLRTLNKTKEGKTAKQRNPHVESSLAWAVWIIGRIGGWNGYYRPPGPKVLHTGLQIFTQIKTGWQLARHK